MKHQVVVLSIVAEQKTLIISELFHSIQGESSYAGYPCSFIRLSGCNLRCNYCDAKYTYEEKGKITTIEEICNFINKKSIGIVQITGGEPLLQENIYPLIKELIKLERIVLLETNGSLSLKNVPKEVIKIMDVKCPDSTTNNPTKLNNLSYLTKNDEVKFVINSRTDYLWAVNFIETHLISADIVSDQQKRPKILFSPVYQQLAATELAEWILADQLPVKLQIQLHTILWPNKSRGY